MKSRRNASSSGVPKVLSRWICRSRALDGRHRLVGASRSGSARRRAARRHGRHVLAERRHLDRLVAELHVREAEAPADDPAVPEQLLDLVRMRRGADVEVLGPPAEQQIAHAAADQVRGVVGVVQPVEHLERIGIDGRARNRVVRSGDDDGLGHPARIVTDPDADVRRLNCHVFNTLRARFGGPLCYDAPMIARARPSCSRWSWDRPALAGRPARTWPAPASSSTTAGSTRPSSRPTAARKTPDTADAAAIVLARAHLERYRQLADPTDLGAARSALSGVERRSARHARPRRVPDRARRLAVPRGRLRRGRRDLRVGDGDRAGGRRRAPARRCSTGTASAMERWAAPYVTSRRAQMLTRLVARMEREQAKNPGLAGRRPTGWPRACAAQGDTDRAWQAAIAAWVRAPLAGDARAGAARRHRPAGAARASSPTAAAKPPRANAKAASPRCARSGSWSSRSGSDGAGGQGPGTGACRGSRCHVIA